MLTPSPKKWSRNITAEDDSILYTGDEAYRLSLRVGQFALLYPGEGHMPKLVCGIPSHVDKIVVKIAIK